MPTVAKVTQHFLSLGRQALSPPHQSQHNRHLHCHLIWFFWNVSYGGQWIAMPASKLVFGLAATNLLKGKEKGSKD